MKQDTITLRRAVVSTCTEMTALDINQGTAGNVSARVENGYLITPSGVDYESMAPTDIVAMDMQGNSVGALTPSSEWRMHFEIYRECTDAGAIVHTHATFCTALACHQLDIPAFHYMIAVAGGRDIRCAPYATFGTQELADNMLVALKDRSACLLAHHGMICYGRNLKQALKLAVEVESLAKQYWSARQLGEPEMLDDAEMETVLGLFSGYGQ